jgi:hypothetical protein
LININFKINLTDNISFTTVPSVQAEHEEMRLEIQIERAAVAVELDVQPPAGSLCAQRKEVTEIALLGHPQDGDFSAEPRQKGAAITAAASRRQSLNMQSRSDADIREMVTRRDAPVISAAAVLSDPNVVSDTKARVALKQVVVPNHDRGFGVLCITLTVFTLAMLAFGYTCRYNSNKIGIMTHADATPVGASAAQVSAPAFYYIGDTDSFTDTDSTATASSFYIGDEDEPPEQAASCTTGSCTEPEPDAELDPSSCPSTPRPSDRPSVVACIATKAQAVQPFSSSRPSADSTVAATSPSLPQAPITAEAARRSVEMFKPRNVHAMLTRAARRRQSCEKHVVMMFASPLFLPGHDRLHELPQAPFEIEWNLLLQAYEDSVYNIYNMIGKTRKLQPIATLVPRPFTAANLQNMMAPSTTNAVTSILHLSAHGDSTGQALILENGKKPCTGHPYSLKELRTMLALRSDSQDAGPRLVILNACHSRSAGVEFTEHGVPHVLCGLGSIRDSWSRLFFHKLYTCLFKGNTVMEAYKAAIVALHNDPNCPEVAAKSFCLLPEDSPHDEVLFTLDPLALAAVAAARAQKTLSTSGSDASEVEDASSSQASDTEREYSSSKRVELAMLLRSPNPLNRVVPALPEDFMGRSQDVWRVLQLLTDRRLVMICGSASAGHGIGKSAVIDAVHRALTMQMGAVCVDVRNLGHDCENISVGCKCWIMQTREIVQKIIARISRREGGGLLQRCVRPRKCWQSSWHYQSFGAGATRARETTCLTCSSDALAIDVSMKSLVTDLKELARLSLEQNVGREWWPATAANGLFAGAGGAILIFDGCEELLEQPHFQEAVDDILAVCPGYRVLFSAQRPPAFSQSWRRYKIAKHELEGLPKKDAALLFLRRTNRPLRWEELLLGTDEASKIDYSPTSEVHLPAPGKDREKILDLVAEHPAVAAQLGNPKALIELADKVDSSLSSLQDLEQISLAIADAPRRATKLAMAPSQGSMSALDAQTIGSPCSLLTRAVQN